MIGLDPDIVWRVFGGGPRSIAARSPIGCVFALRRAAIAALRALIAESRIDTRTISLRWPPASSLSRYDMVREMERLAEAKPDPIGVPTQLCSAHSDGCFRCG